MLERIPENKRDEVSGVINEINNAEERTMHAYRKHIRLSFKCNSPSTHYSNFDNIFKQWLRKSDIEHLRKANEDIPSMKTIYTNMHDTFDGILKKVKQLRETVVKKLELANNSFNELLNAENSEDINKIVKEILSNTKKIGKQHKKLFKAFVKMNDTIENYNNKRVQWTLYLIGTTKKMDFGLTLRLLKGANKVTNKIKQKN